MTTKIAISNTDDEKVFSTENLSFSVQQDLMDYEILPEVKMLCQALVDIYDKSNSTAIIDLLKDISSSIELEVN